LYIALQLSCVERDLQRKKNSNGKRKLLSWEGVVLEGGFSQNALLLDKSDDTYKKSRQQYQEKKKTGRAALRLKQ
jgi:hypothetical protein